MSLKNLNTRLGIFAICFSAFLILIAIPNWVYSPSNVQKLVLSPAFWPYVLSGIIALAGVGLIFVPETNASEDEPQPQGRDGYFRLLGMAVIMGATLFLLPRLGMVWTTMITFGTTAFFFGTRYPKAAAICAIVMPLLLYAFFAHVAGVAIPQGEFVRLP